MTWGNVPRPYPDDFSTQEVEPWRGCDDLKLGLTPPVPGDQLRISFHLAAHQVKQHITLDRVETDI